MSYNKSETGFLEAGIFLLGILTTHFLWMDEVQNANVTSYEYKVVNTTPYTEDGYTIAILEGHGDKFHIETDEYVLPGDVLYKFCINMDSIESCRFKRHIPYKEFKYVDQ